jgi:hypothetical protein
MCPHYQAAKDTPRVEILRRVRERFLEEFGWFAGPHCDIHRTIV